MTDVDADREQVVPDSMKGQRTTEIQLPASPSSDAAPRHTTNVVAMPGWQVAVLLGLLIAVLLGCNIVLNPWKSGFDYTVIPDAATALILVQPFLLGIWGILAPQRAIDRWASAWLLAGALVCSSSLGTFLEHGTTGRDIWEHALSLLTLFVVALVTVWLVAPRFHWRMWRGAGTEPFARSRGELQFSLRRILIWFALAAVLFGTATYVLPSPDIVAGKSNIAVAVIEDFLSTRDVLPAPLLMLLVVALATFPLTLADRRWSLPASLIGLTLCVVGIVKLCSVQDKLGEFDWDWDWDWFFAGLVLVAQASVMIVCLLVVRAIGFRTSVSKRDEARLATLEAKRPLKQSASEFRRRHPMFAHWRFGLTATLLVAVLATIGWEAVQRMPGWRDRRLEGSWVNTGLEAKYEAGQLIRLQLLNKHGMGTRFGWNEDDDRVTDAQIELIWREDVVPTLNLLNARITNEQLAELGKSAGLKELSIHGKSITDEGLRRLKNQPTIEKLDIQGASITDEGLAYVASMPALKELDLSNTSISDDGLTHLATTGRIEVLDLTNTRITDVGLRQLANLQKLTTLRVSKTAVADAGLDILRDCRKLAEIQLSGTPISDAGLIHLVGWPELAVLWLNDTSITDAGLTTLARCEKLRTVCLQGTHVTSEGTQKLQAALPKVTIDVLGNQQ